MHPCAHAFDTIKGLKEPQEPVIAVRSHSPQPTPQAHDVGAPPGLFSLTQDLSVCQHRGSREFLTPDNFGQMPDEEDSVAQSQASAGPVADSAASSQTSTTASKPKRLRALKGVSDLTAMERRAQGDDQGDVDFVLAEEARARLLSTAARRGRTRAAASEGLEPAQSRTTTTTEEGRAASSRINRDLQLNPPPVIAPDPELRRLVILEAVDMMKANTKPQLVERCKELNISGISSLNKPGLVAQIYRKSHPLLAISVDDVRSAVPSKSSTIKVLTGNATGWTELALNGTSRIIEKETATRQLLPNVVPELRRVSVRAVAAVGEVSRLVPNLGVGTALFCAFVDKMSAIVLERSTQGSGHSSHASLDPVNLSQLLGLLFQLNLSSLSVNTKFPVDARLTKDEFLGLFHQVSAFGALPGSKAEQTSGGTWQSYTSLMEQYRPIEDAFAESSSSIVDTLMAQSLDDDLVNFAGRMGGTSTKTIISHEGEGQTIDVVTWVPVSVVQRATVRRGDVMGKYVERLNKDGSVLIVANDRYYVRTNTAAAIATSGSSSIGPLDEKYIGSQPFDLTDAGDVRKGYKPGEAEDVLRKESKGFNLVSFGGVGPHSRVAINKDGVTVTAVVNRSSHSKKPGFSLIVSSSPVRNGLGQIDTAKHALAANRALQRNFTFVRVPGHVPRTQNLNLLSRAAAEDEIANMFRTLFDANGVVVETQAQGEASWFARRRLTITALIGATLLAKLVRIMPGRWRLVSKILRQNAEEAIAESFDDLIGEEDGSSGLPALVPTTSLSHSPEADEALSAEIEIGSQLGPGGDDEDEEKPEGDHTSVTSNVCVYLAETLAKSALSAFTGNVFTAEGHAQESRAQHWITEVHGVEGQVLTTGFLSRANHPHIGVSPDMLLGFRFEGDANLTPMVAEHKSSKYYTPNPIAARSPVFLQCGTPEYYASVPQKFRGQLAMQAAVTGVKHIMYICSAPTAPSASFIICYSQECLDEVLSALTDNDGTGWLRELHLRMRDEVQSDLYITAWLLERLPELQTIYSSALVSWIPLCRAVALMCAKSPHVPIPPTHCFRPQIIDDYDTLKGGTDQMGRYLSEAMRPGASTIHTSVQGKIAFRFYYYGLLNAFKLTGIVQFFKDVLANKSSAETSSILSKLTLAEVRDGAANKTGTFPDFCLAVGQELMSRRIPLGMLRFKMGEVALSTQPPATPVSSGSIEVWGADRNYLRKCLLERANSESRQISDIDFIAGTRFVRDGRTFSPRTPGHVIISSAGLEEIMGRQLQDALQIVSSDAQTTSQQPSAEQEASQEGIGRSRSKKRGLYRPSRLAAWDGPGLVLRLSLLVIHDTDGETSAELRKIKHTCLVCGRQRKGSSIARCVTCGEYLCLEPPAKDQKPCMFAFHNDKSLQATRQQLDMMEPEASAPSTASSSAVAAAGIESDSEEESGGGEGGLDFGTDSP